MKNITNTQIRFISTLCFMLLPILSKAQAPNNAYTLVYEENFNGDTLNTNDWDYRVHNLYVGGYGRADNVTVETSNGIGYLRIDYNEWDANNDGTDDKVGGGIISIHSFGYGYYEAKINFYDESIGFHQSFWTMGTGNMGNLRELANQNKIPFTNALLEIDGIELDSDWNSGGANFHWHKPTRITPSGSHSSYSSGYINTNNWITIGFDWQPGLIIWYVDGTERHRFSYSDKLYAAQNVWLTGLANNGEWFGQGGTPQPDAHMKVDYFKYYTKPFYSNLTSNGSFEHNGQISDVPYSWIQDDGIYNSFYSDCAKIIHDDGNAYDEVAYLNHEYNASNAGLMSSRQELKGIANGIYKMSAWVKSSGGMSTAKMSATAKGETEKNIPIPENATWTQIVVDSIMVNENNCEIAFTTNGTNGQWVSIDKVEFIKIDKPSSVNERASSNSIVFPNPVGDFLCLKNSQDFETIRVCNMQGQSVLLKSLIEGSNFDVSFLSEGVYILILEKGRTTQSQKFIKK